MECQYGAQSDNDDGGHNMIECGPHYAGEECLYGLNECELAKRALRFQSTSVQ